MIELTNVGSLERHLGASQIIDHWESYKNGPAFVGRNQHGIIAAAGVINLWTGVGEAWAILTPRAKGMAVLRAFRETFRLIQIAHDYHRIQASVQADFDDGVRFAKFMGFESEGVMRSYDAEKHDFLRMAKIGR